jgi:hypothetical protein
MAQKREHLIPPQQIRRKHGLLTQPRKAPGTYALAIQEIVRFI